MEYKGKQLKVFYSDGRSVSRKDGLCTDEGTLFITLDDCISIPFSAIIRIEFNNGEAGR